MIEAIALLSSVLLWACASTPPGEGGNANEQRRESRDEARSGEARPSARLLGVAFAPGYTVPVIRMGSGDVLDLTFDVAVSGNFSIRFMPADRDWTPSSAPEPHPMPRPDRILEYQDFFGLDDQYVRYSYQFPNSRVSFPRSGNYVLEVYESDSGASLFSRDFAVSDDLLDIVIQPSARAYVEFPDEIRPEARVDLPRDPNFATEDCTVCFVKNGWIDDRYCTDEFRLEGPTYVYTAHDMFRPTVQVRYLDLRSDQYVSRRFEHTVPNQLILFPDDLRERPSYTYATPIPRSPAVSAPQLGPYVRAQFSLFNVPASAGAPYIVGNFNDWKKRPDHRMNYDQASDMYTLELLVEENEIYYAYLWDDQRSVIDRTQFEGPPAVAYTVLLYAKDWRYPTDRLLSVRGDQLP